MGDDEPVPFGIVLRGVKADFRTLNVKWGDTATEGCSLSYTLATASKTSKQRWADAEAVCQK
ncbi:hypothetical protein WJ63_30115 [Burkholderia pyrrocinia]|nr:hypothetical protein WJ63_30115 [Burkholderia pyrrocinia]WGS47928.1 hypothetical protein LFL97_39040 [Burkholderia sp. JSH-S8]